MTIPEVGKVYKVNRASLCKITGISKVANEHGELFVDTVQWPSIPGKRSYEQRLTYGATSGNNFVEHPNGTWKN